MIENFEKSTDYVRKLFKDDEKILEIKRKALENKVPIVTEEVLSFMIQILKMNKCKKALEIGTAIGYSSYYISKYAKLTTIEIDENRYNTANENFKKLDIKVNSILGDAKEKIPEINDTFDFIFIDAAKSSYKEFFDMSYSKLNDNGVIFIDNILFRSYICDEEYPKKYKTIVRKLNEFILYLNEKFDFTLLPFGDGVAIVRKEEK